MVDAVKQFRQPSIALLLVALAVAPADAQTRPTTTTSRTAQCFRVDLDEAHGPIKRIQVDYQKKEFMVEQWGAPQIRFVIAATCEPGKNGALSCFRECEGGNAEMSIRRDGILALNARDFALYAEVRSALPGARDVDAALLSGRFNLAPVADQQCAGDNEADLRPEADLRKGEFEPRVKELEQSLVDLGYLARRPSWYFTGKTDAAVAQFQRAIGMKPTGVADSETFRKLRLTAAVRGGSC
jgi:hypothetical protein